MARVVFMPLLLVGCYCNALHAQYVFLGFEEFPEGTVISTQYSGHGVQFSHLTPSGAPSALLPIIAAEGAPQVAFASAQGLDGPMATFSRGLTDAIQSGNIGVGSDLLIEFDPPVDAVGFYVVDIDGGETFTANYRDPSGLVLGTETHSSGGPGTGNGVSTRYLSTTAVPLGNPIGSVLLNVPSFSGWALDGLGLLRSPQAPAPEYAIEEETAPGSGQWNSMGTLRCWQTNASSEGFYVYGVNENGSYNGVAPPSSNEGGIRFLDTPGGIKIQVVFDATFDGSGGRAEWEVTALNDPDGLFFEAQDEPASGVSLPDQYFSNASGTVLGAAQSWSLCCTDGATIGGIEPDSVLFFEFTDTDSDPNTPCFLGLNAWKGEDPSGMTISYSVPPRRLRVTPQLNAPRASIQQPGGVGPWTFSITGLTPGNQVYTAVSFEPAAGGAGSGPTFGLFTTTPVVILNQIQSAGVVPFNFVAPSTTATIGPLLTPPMTADVLLVQVPPGQPVSAANFMPVRHLVVN